MSSKDNFHKIQELISSGQRDNIELAFELAKGANISEITLLRPWNKLLHLAKQKGRITAIDRLVKLFTLSYLNLSYRELGQLPAQIGQLGNLTVLGLESCELDRLPASIGNLNKLNLLNLNKNYLSYLPESIGQLAALHSLYAIENCLERLPESIGNLKQLKHLSLNNNLLSALPENLGQSQLEHIDLNHNQLTNFPESLSQLTTIKILRLKGNLIPIKQIEAFKNRMPSCQVYH